MCVAIPARVIAIGEPTAASIPGTVSMIDSERDIDLVMVPDARVGDYVVVHSGYAIEVIPEQRATETMRLLGVEEGGRTDPL
ncbi:MAG TPA: HypC/HybG/HupF family hydrogenase formation chaperone [Acidimicrobiia bacterium]|jgi:hydrogenase expression/formation protein HypC|nr:HypC/HybG/HupF family hydrogenase formation chaperone [Acidimicrobiia bacterium]